MFRGLIIYGALMLTLGVGDLPRGSLSQNDLAALQDVCKHYVNRARFMERDASPEFVVVLADGCEFAQKSLQTGDFRQRQAAAGFLLRLRSLRDTVIDMNMTRVFGHEYGPSTDIAYDTDARSEPVRRVSQTGEYLIAHQMGLLYAYRTWLDSDPQIEMAVSRN